MPSFSFCCENTAMPKPSEPPWRFLQATEIVCSRQRAGLKEQKIERAGLKEQKVLVQKADLKCEHIHMNIDSEKSSKFSIVG